ncbi:hypothetical protein A1351_12765 [Methylosinus sp. R-45379]|nr:hypothetical protein A1351_12765 [Methylosinus sp. R-45379]
MKMTASAPSLRDTLLRYVLNDPTAGGGNFIYRLNAAVPREAQRSAVALLGGEAGRDVELTIGDIVDATDRLAAAYAQEGIRPREVVSLLLDDSFDYFLHFVALTSIGATASLVNSGLDLDTVRGFIGIVRPRLLVVESRRHATNRDAFDVIAGESRAISVDALVADPARERPPLYEHEDDDVIMLGHTSGTTGLPKAVIFTHESMFHGVRQQVERQLGSHVLSALPHSHGAAISLLMLSLTRGARVSILGRKEPASMLEAIERIGPDVVIAFPKIFVDLCRESFEGRDLGSVQYWIATGDANHERHIRKLVAQGHHIDSEGRRKAGSFFVDNVGSSEFAFAAFRNVHGQENDRYDRCVGRPFPWVETAVFDEHDRRLPAGRVGRLGVKSKSVTKGYWNNHTLTELNKIAGYWLTGDLVFTDEEGLFYHVDRTSDVIVTKSGVLYSCQAEELLLKHLPELFDVSLILRSEAGSERVTALVELSEDAASADASTLLVEMNRLFAQRGWPSIDELEIQSAHEHVGATGKKLKRVLRSIPAGRAPEARRTCDESRLSVEERAL